MSSLKKQAISGVKWTTLQTSIAGVSGAVGLVVKARFLSPTDFGYIAVVVIVIDLIRLLESFGISQAIIQRDAITVKESSSLFYFNIIISIFSASLLYLLSPLIAVFFSLPSLEEYLPIVCVIALITGPSLLFRAFLEKRLYFKHISLIEIARNLIILGTTVFFLIRGLGVYGVIYAQIVGAAFATLSIVLLTVRLKSTSLTLYFNPVKLVPFLRFGAFVAAKQLMTFATHKLDEVVIGYFLSPDILGIYHFGKNMLERIRSLMTKSFGKVLFPVFSKLKHQPEKLTFAYQNISRYIAFVAFPVFAGIAATAHLFVPIIFGRQWEDSIIVFQVFSAAVILLVLTANVSSSLMYSLNKPETVFYIDIVTNALYFVSLFFFAPLGMIAVLISYSFYVVYKTLTLQYYTNRQLIASFWSYFRQLITPALTTLIMVMAVLLFQLLSSPVLGDLLQLVVSIIVGVIIYIVMAWLCAKETISELKSAIIKGEIVK